MLFRLLACCALMETIVSGRYFRKPIMRLKNTIDLGDAFLVGKGTVKLLKPLGFSYTISGDELQNLTVFDDQIDFVGDLNRMVVELEPAPLTGRFRRRRPNSTYEFLQYRNYDVQLKPNDTVYFYLNLSYKHVTLATVIRHFTVLENYTIEFNASDYTF